MAFAAGGAAEPRRESGSSGKIRRTEGTPVVDDRRIPLAIDGDTLLGQMGREIGAVIKRSDIAVGEGELEAAAVLSVEITR